MHCLDIYTHQLLKWFMIPVAHCQHPIGMAFQYHLLPLHSSQPILFFNLIRLLTSFYSQGEQSSEHVRHSLRHSASKEESGFDPRAVWDYSAQMLQCDPWLLYWAIHGRSGDVSLKHWTFHISMFVFILCLLPKRSFSPLPVRVLLPL